MQIWVGEVAFTLPIQHSIHAHLFNRDNTLVMYLESKFNGEEFESLHGELPETFAGRVGAAQQ